MTECDDSENGYNANAVVVLVFSCFSDRDTKGLRKDSQTTKKEYANQNKFLSSCHLQTPNHRPRKAQNHDVRQHIRYAVPSEKVYFIQALSGLIFIPEVRYGLTAGNRCNNACHKVAGYDGPSYPYGYPEFAYAPKETIVEKEQ